jgi:putative ABC transport system permease protein
VQVSYGRNSVATVVGVVADSYERYPNGVGEPRCYVPWDDTRAGAFAMFARTDRAGDVAPIIRSILREVDPRLAPAEIGTVADIARTYYRGPLAIANGLSVAGAIAIALAAIGLFGILSYGAAQRTHEFGIRLALGGRPSDLRRALISESFAVVAIGAAAGLVIAGGPMLWLMSQGLNTISLADPRVWATVISLLLLVSVGAVARPLRFVSRLSPMTALRDV